MKLKWAWLTLCIILFSNPLLSQEIKSTPFGKGIFNFVGKDSTWSMKFAARMQILGSVNAEEGEKVETNMLIRRARLKFDGFALSPKLVYKIEIGLSNRDVFRASEYNNNTPGYLMDAVIKWNFYKSFVLWFGQTKLPGNRERVVSSGDLQFVDRSILNAKFNIDRDMGIQLRNSNVIGKNFVIREIFAFSQGEGRNVTVGNIGGFQYTGRIELLPFGNFSNKGDYFESDLSRENSPKLSLAATYDFNNNAVKTRSNLGSFMKNDEGHYETNITTTFVDAMFKYKGLSLMGEYAYRDADDPIAKNSDGTLTGDIVEVGNAINLQSAYLFKSNFEVGGRFSNYEALTDITGKNSISQYTLGFSKYFVGHKLKVQTDFNYIDEHNASSVFLWRLQMDLHF